MRLNYKRTICVGFAFFLINAFWQAYDNSIPILLIDKYGMSQTVSGIIMAIDNILALFVLPLFGTLSDRTQTKMGRRTPFILGGTVVAVISFVLLPFPGKCGKISIGCGSGRAAKKNKKFFRKNEQNGIPRASV